MTLFVTAHDKEDRAVRDLRPQEVQVLEDGKAQSIQTLSNDRLPPLTLGVLIDISGSRRDEMPGAELGELSKFFRAVLRSGDAAFLAAFNERTFQLTKLTDSTEELDNGLRSIASMGSRGSTALYDAIIWGCDQGFIAKAGRRTLVIITDAEDNASSKRMEDALEAAQRTKTTMLILDPSDRGPGSRRVLRTRAVARRLAQDTGGHYFLLFNPKGFSGALGFIAEEFRDAYTLTYMRSSTALDGKFHRIKVETTRKGVKLTYRSGYYAPKH